MVKKKKKLTPAQKAAKKKRQKEYMTVFMNGMQKRVKRPQAIDCMSVDEFIKNNADPIWLHQNEMWEYIDPEECLWQGDMPLTVQEWMGEISTAYIDAVDAIPFGPFVGQKITPKDLFHLAPAICLKFREIEQTESNLKKATDAALSSYVATKDIVGVLFDIPQMAFAFSYVASHYGLDLILENECTSILDYIEDNIDQLIELSHKNKKIKRRTKVLS